MTWLLDVNLLLALNWPSHVHHALAHDWFARVPQRLWASCALTQIAFVRISSNPRFSADAVSVVDAIAALRVLQAMPNHRFWGDSPSPLAMPGFSEGGLVGHRQVTDAWLAGLAAHHGGRLATLDRGLAAAGGQRVELVA